MDNCVVNNENGNSVIVLKGRVDTVSAPLVEEELNKHELVGDVVIDAKDLEYISSSGLRVVLRLAKQFKNLKVINVSEEIYEIFDVTGFIDIFTVVRA